MTPRELLESHRDDVFEDVDGFEHQMELEPGLSEGRIDELEEQLPGPLPDEIRELVAYTGGVHGLFWETLDFRGELTRPLESAFPHGLGIAHDGTGNYCVVDVEPETGEWGAVYYVCHDPPVVTLIADDFTTFLEASLSYQRSAYTDHDNPIHQATTEGPSQIYGSSPYMMNLADARTSGDPTLRDFAATLENRFDICDLRDAKPGEGFDWSRAGRDTELVRCGTEPIFAVKKGLFDRLTSLVGL